MTLCVKIISLTEHHDFPSIPRKSTAQSRHLCLHGRSVLQQWYFAWSVSCVCGAHLMFHPQSHIIHKTTCIFPSRSSAVPQICCAAASIPQLSCQSQQHLRKCNTLNRMVVWLYVHQPRLIAFISCHCSGHVQGQAWHQKMEQNTTEPFMLPNTLAVTWILGNALHRTMHDLCTETHLHDLSFLYS